MKVKLKKMYCTENSCIAIMEDRLYIVDTKTSTISPTGLTICPGLQVELGRNIDEFIEALKLTRLPIYLRLLKEKKNIQVYNVCRMHTGNIDNIVLASLYCQDKIITHLVFNRAILKDNEYKKYCRISALHNLSIPKDLGEHWYRAAQLESKLKLLFSNDLRVINVKESNDKVDAVIDLGFKKYCLTFVGSAENSKLYTIVTIKDVTNESFDKSENADSNNTDDESKE